MLLRRRNMIAPGMMPYATPVGPVYDSGDFPAVLDRALESVGMRDFQLGATLPPRGKRRGIGISCFLEHAGGARVRVPRSLPRGRTVEIRLGIQATGQGHSTIFGRLAAERLGIPRELVVIRQGDSNLGVTVAGTSTASRTTMMSGAAALRAIEIAIERGKQVASLLLEAGEADIGYRAGAFEVMGTDRRVSLFEVAEKAAELAASGAAVERLDASAVVRTPQTFPNGCHIAEVEIDPDTGRSRSSPIQRSMIVEHRSTLPWSKARSMAASRRGSARRSWKRRSMTVPADSCSLDRSWIMRCRGRIMYRISARRFTWCRRSPIRSASRAPVRPEPPAHLPRS